MSCSSGALNQELAQEQNGLSSQVYLCLPRHPGQQKVRNYLGFPLCLSILKIFQHFNVSAELLHIPGKKATESAHKTLAVLERYGIMQEDLF